MSLLNGLFWSGWSSQMFWSWNVSSTWRIFSNHPNCWTTPPPKKCYCDGLSMSPFGLLPLHHALKGRELQCLAASPVGSVLHARDWRQHSFPLLLLQCRFFFFYLHESNVEAETVTPLGGDLIRRHWLINRFSKAVVPCLCSYRATWNRSATQACFCSLLVVNVWRKYVAGENVRKPLFHRAKQTSCINYFRVIMWCHAIITSCQMPLLMQWLQFFEPHTFQVGGHCCSCQFHWPFSNWAPPTHHPVLNSEWQPSLNRAPLNLKTTQLQLWLKLVWKSWFESSLKDIK